MMFGSRRATYLAAGAAVLLVIGILAWKTAAEPSSLPSSIFNSSAAGGDSHAEPAAANPAEGAGLGGLQPAPSRSGSRESSFAGSFVCLPHKDKTKPQTKECRAGIRADDGTYHAIDASSLSESDAALVASGSRVIVRGLYVPAEALSTDMWWKYDMKGIMSITSVTAVR